MQKIAIIVMSIAAIFALQLWQIDVARADDDWNNKKCDLSGLWIGEADPVSGAQATFFYIPLDPAKKRYACPHSWIMPLPGFAEGDSVVAAGGVVERTSGCSFIATGYYYVINDGVRVLDIVANGTWFMVDEDTLITTNGKFSVLEPDGAPIFCDELPDSLSYRLKVIPPSELPCP